MNHGKMLLIGAVQSVRGNVRDMNQLMVEASSILEKILVDTKYTSRAPFYTVSLILRIGTVRDLRPDYGRIDKRHSELPVAVALDFAALRDMTRGQVLLEFLEAALAVLVDVADRYDLPARRLVQMMTDLRNGNLSISE